MDIEPSNYSHAIILKTRDKKLIGFTNNPDKMTLNNVRSMLIKSKVSIRHNNATIDLKDILFRVKGSDNYYDKLSKPLYFNDNIVEVEMVIMIMEDNRPQYYTIENKLINVYQYKESDFNNIPVICKVMDTKYVCKVSDYTLIGEIADFLYSRSGININDMYLTLGHTMLDYDKCWSDYKNKYKHTYFPLRCIGKLRGGMFHSSSGKSGDYEALTSIMFDMDEL